MNAKPLVGTIGKDMVGGSHRRKGAAPAVTGAASIRSLPSLSTPVFMIERCQSCPKRLPNTRTRWSCGGVTHRHRSASLDRQSKGRGTLWLSRSGEKLAGTAIPDRRESADRAIGAAGRDMISTVQHDLARVGPYGFQDLAAALAIAAFGPQVQPLGPGRDGGRDMICNGKIAWAGTDSEPGETWDGYTVFQAKHKLRLDAVAADNATWLWTQVRKELEAWADPDSEREKVPDYWVIVTNVPLTPTPGVGGFDMLNKQIQQYIDSFADSSRDVDSGAVRKEKLRRLQRIHAWRIWDGNQIDGLLSVHQNVRRAFGAFLTVPDVFAHLADFTDRLPVDQLETGLRRHARARLVGDRWIYFDEAGSGVESGMPIDRVAVDLPIAPGPDGKRRTVFGHILDHGDTVLKPFLRLHRGPRHIVVVGGPGNGKTTMSKFLVQAYRAALLEGAEDLGADHHVVIEETGRTLRQLGRGGLPKFRRWPMRIDLAEYAEEQGLNQDSTLLRWIAHKVSQRSDVGAVTPSAMSSWMQQWPWFLVLDGLDEVTEPRTRKRLIEQITEFVSEADGDNCDLLVVLTTRPTGYVENIAPAHFERLDLARLEIDEAVRYGQHVTRVRLKDDEEKIERIDKQLVRAAADDALRHLMQTPLQVLIMTIIVEGAGQIGPDRYSLFWSYYDTVFKRERQKPTGLAKLLQEHASTILTLHQRVGFELQVRSENDGSTALMTPQELRDVAWKVLQENGFRPSDVDSELLNRIVTAATNRLVLLTPISRGHEGLGFDVRSLQELMAARFLTTGPIEDIIARLRIAAANPHWRNTWIFAAGHQFSEPQPHQHEAVVTLVEQVDRDAAYRLGRVCPIAPALALDLIDDGMTRSHPKYRDRLLHIAFEILEIPSLPDPLAVARVLVRAATANTQVRVEVAKALSEGLGGSFIIRDTTESICGAMQTATREISVPSSVRSLATMRGKRPRRHDHEASERAAARYVETLTELSGTGPSRKILEDAVATLENLSPSDGHVDVAPLITGLRDPHTAELLEMALENLLGHATWPQLALARTVLPMIYRAPIGERLRQTYP
ncbi:NACHT domain-containing protein [Nocardia sp. NPDC055321]